MPKISYLVSTYDSAEFLDQHLQDLIVNQTDPDFEVIVVNPNSPGHDSIIAEKWASLDERITYLEFGERENYGCSWLRAWAMAKGEYVSNSNTDDKHYPSFTAEVYDAIFEAGCCSDRRIGFCYTGLDIVDLNGRVKHRIIKPPFNFKDYCQNCLGGPQLTWLNSESFRNSLDWNLMWQRASEHRSAFDYWLMLYFMSLGFHGLSIPKILTIYTDRADSIEHKNYGKASTYESLASISEFFREAVPDEYPEFKDFTNLPIKEEWVAKRC